MSHKEEHIVFFDGVCNLCNSAVQKILLNDKKGIYKFASLQSDTAKEKLTPLGVDTSKLESILYLKNGKVYDRTRAIFRVYAKLKFPFPLINILWIFPYPLRDLGYKIIANNRYKWFGKSESCMLPKPEWKDRFLD